MYVTRKWSAAVRTEFGESGILRTTTVAIDGSVGHERRIINRRSGVVKPHLKSPKPQTKSGSFQKLSSNVTCCTISSSFCCSAVCLLCNSAISVFSLDNLSSCESSCLV